MREKEVGKETVFDTFRPELKKWVKSRFRQPTEIQKQVIPVIVKGQNTLVISETGSGKTESVMLPVLERWLEADRPLGKSESSGQAEGHKPFSILYITPLKSLNRDMLKRIHWWSEKLGFEVSVRHGDTSQYERTMQAENPSDMLISTPETMQTVLVGKKLREHISNVKWVIVDEVHELVDSKRGAQLSIALERLKALTKEKFGRTPQIVGLSATVGSPEKVAQFLQGSSKPLEIINESSAKQLDIRVESPSKTRIDSELSQEIMMAPDTTARLRRIIELIKEKKSVLVFTNTRESAEALSSRLKVMDRALPVETHHSSLSKDVRIAAEKDFRDQKLKALLCTSSLELGIDIGSIDFVLQYMSPRQAIKLLQRVGRAGHSLDKVSEGIILASDTDDCFEASVIAKLAMGKWVEPTHIYTKALDVLAHQVIGMALENYRFPLDKAYEIAKGAYPFRDVTEVEFLEVCRLLHKLRLAWVNREEDYEIVGKENEKKETGKGFKLSDFNIKRSKFAWEYYYGNLSTIPDTKNYRIIDVVTNQAVGTLDAEFIAMHGSPGTSFIVKGQSWKILDVGYDKVSVEPMPGIEASIPAWKGELIPVTFEIAQGVGKLRRDIAGILENGFGYTKHADADSREILEKIQEKNKQEKKIKRNEDLATVFLLASYPINKATSKRLLTKVKEQLDWGFVPTDKQALVEYDKENVVIHTCWGSLVNDTLGRVISSELMKTVGSVGIETDPYRITLNIPHHSWNEALDILKKMDKAIMETSLELNLPNTQLFRWRFLHVAKRLGIIAKHGDFGKGYIQKVVERYVGTPAYEEALNEIYQDKLDVKNSERVLEMLKKKEIELVVRPGISPIGELGLSKRFEIMAPKRPEKEIFELFQKRLGETYYGMLCMQCGNWVTAGHVKDFAEELKCKKCSAKLIAPVPRRWMDDAEKLLKRHFKEQSLAKEEEKWLDWLTNAATLVITNGKDAIRVLSGRGVGPATAGRILNKGNKGQELLRDILEAEKKYVMTRRFWSR